MRDNVRADRAFSKLYLFSDADRELCERWNRVTLSDNVKKHIDEFRKDAKFMTLYNRAWESTQVPIKRKSMIEFLDYFDFMYGYRIEI